MDLITKELNKSLNTMPDFLSKIIDRKSGIEFQLFLIIWLSDPCLHALKGSVRPSVRPSEGLSACALYLWSTVVYQDASHWWSKQLAKYVCFLHLFKQNRPRSVSSCHSCLIRVYMICICFIKYCSPNFSLLVTSIRAPQSCRGQRLSDIAKVLLLPKSINWA